MFAGFARGRYPRARCVRRRRCASPARAAWVGLSAEQIFGERDVCGGEQYVSVGELFGGRRLDSRTALIAWTNSERVGVDPQRVVAGVHDRRSNAFTRGLFGPSASIHNGAPLYELYKRCACSHRSAVISGGRVPCNRR